jgi:hypothetical protein
MEIELVIPSAPKTASIGSFIAVAIITPEIILIYFAIALKRIRRKPDFVYEEWANILCKIMPASREMWL